MKFVIPSYRRGATCRDKTVATLLRSNVSPENILVYVATEAEQATYQMLMPDIEVRIGAEGLAGQRRAIGLDHPEDAELAFFDDDIKGIVIKAPDGKLKPCLDIPALFAEGFEMCRTHGTHLFGLYAIDNAYFMRRKWSVGLYFCSGGAYGWINTHNQNYHSELHLKDDYDRTLRVYRADGCVVRMDEATFKTTVNKGEGGLQHELRTIERAESEVAYLLGTYPDLVKLNSRRKSPYPEILLKAINHMKEK